MANVETIPLLLTAGPLGSGLLELRFPPQFAAEIQTLLDDNSIKHSAALEHSVGAEFAIETITVVTSVLGAAGAGGIAVGIASMYKTFVHRHDGKRVIISKDGDIDVSGFSLQKTEEIVERRIAAQAQRDADWFASIDTDQSDH